MDLSYQRLTIFLYDSIIAGEGEGVYDHIKYNIRNLFKMVLTDLGAQLQEALSKVGSVGAGQKVDSTFVDHVLNEIGDALLQADVSAVYVRDVKSRIKADVLDNARIKSQYNVESFEKLGNSQKERVIQRAVVEELTKLLSQNHR